MIDSASDNLLGSRSLRVRPDQTKRYNTALGTKQKQRTAANLLLAERGDEPPSPWLDSHPARRRAFTGEHFLFKTCYNLLYLYAPTIWTTCAQGD